RPDKIRNSRVRVVALLNVSKPRDDAIVHAKIRITTVRMAVARLESVSLTPALASTAVTPASRAESNAQGSQFICVIYAREIVDSRFPQPEFCSAKNPFYSKLGPCRQRLSEAPREAPGSPVLLAGVAG